MNRVGPTPSASYGAVLRTSGFARVFTGLLLCRMGEYAWSVALVLFMLEAYHSVVLAGASLFVLQVPALIASPLTGAYIDRIGRTRMAVTNAVVSASAVALLAVCASVGPPPPVVPLVIAAVGGLCRPVSEAALRALFPSLLPRLMWDRANAMDSASYAAASALGPALTGFAAAAAGVRGGLLLASTTYAICALLVRGVPEPRTSPGADVSSPFRAALAGLGYLLRHATLRGLAVVVSLTNVAWGVIAVVVPLQAERSPGGVAMVGVFYLCSAGAAVISGLVVGRRSSEGKERRLLLAGCAVLSLGMLALAIPGPVVGTVLGMLLAGASEGPIDIALGGLRQRRTDAVWLGRVFSVSFALNVAGVPIGAAAAGAVAAHSVAAACILGSLAVVAAGLGVRWIPAESGRP